MEDIKIIDQFMDEREFRNYIVKLLDENGFTDISIEDARLSDEEPQNNNDLIAKKGKVRYTIQTFLNKEIGSKEIKETLTDMKDEYASKALIITNKEVSEEVIKEAEEADIEIWDRKKFK